MQSPSKILIIDDLKLNRQILSDMLLDYEIIEASGGAEGISILKKEQDAISLVLLDLVMPEVDGYAVLEYMNREGYIDQIPVIIISADLSNDARNQAYALGVIEYITRPFDETVVQHRVENTLLLFSKQKRLERMVAEQIKENEDNNEMMVQILSHIVEFRNGESGTHVINIKKITQMLLEQIQKECPEYNLTIKDIQMISNASALHDIGKISIPEQIINKPGKLTTEEFEIMKTHTTMGAQILENIPYYQNHEMVRTAHNICRWHHERYDGRGYPDGLKGDDIPLSAQVVSLADVYDALTSKRVYKPAYTHKEAIQMIQNGECGSFNPVMLKCFMEISNRIEKLKKRT